MSTVVVLSCLPYVILRLQKAFGALVILFLAVPFASESVHSKNPVNTVSQKSVKGILLSFGRRCVWVHRYVGKIWVLKGQRSRSQHVEV